MPAQIINVSYWNKYDSEDPRFENGHGEIHCPFYGRMILRMDSETPVSKCRHTIFTACPQADGFIEIRGDFRRGYIQDFFRTYEKIFSEEYDEEDMGPFNIDRPSFLADIATAIAPNDTLILLYSEEGGGHGDPPMGITFYIAFNPNPPEPAIKAKKKTQGRESALQPKKGALNKR